MESIVTSVVSNREVTPGTYLTWLESPQIASQSKAGQFVMVRCREDLVLRRPLSVHQLVDGARFALLFAAVGKGTHWLAQCKAGDEIDLFGPLGNGFLVSPTSRKLLLVAGGIGIAPLCLLAQETIRQGRTVKLLLGAPTAAQLYPAHLLPPGTELVVATDDGTKGKKGMVIDLLPDFVDWADQVFACGPVPMYRSMAAQQKQLKGKPVQVSLETRMGCGIGTCYSCTAKTKDGLKQVCKDGPVFELDSVLWDTVAV